MSHILSLRYIRLSCIQNLVFSYIRLSMQFLFKEGEGIAKVKTREIICRI